LLRKLGFPGADRPRQHDDPQRVAFEIQMRSSVPVL
jgi:hypothetical protein